MGEGPRERAALPELSDYCRVRIHTEFRAEDRQEAEELLRQYGGQAYQCEPERIRRDILELATGNLPSLRKLLELANKDYRDLIVCAEYEPGPGQSRLSNARKKATPWLDEL